MKIPVPPGMKPPETPHAWGITVGPNFGQVPEAHRKLIEAIYIDPPGGHIEQALQTHVMALAYFGGGAFPDHKIGRAWAWSILRNFPEATVLSGMKFPVIVGSYRFGMRGGCVPDVALMQEIVTPPMLELYYQGDKTPWLEEFYAHYQIERPKNHGTRKNGEPSNGYDDSMFFDWEPNANNLFNLWKNFKFPMTSPMAQRVADVAEITQQPEIVQH